MPATYNPNNLNELTDEGKLNIVRYLLGDTTVADAELQDEEIYYNISQSPNNLYLAASFGANAVASKYSTYVTTELDGALSADYSDLYERFRNLATQLKADGNRYSGTSLGIFAGGLPKYAGDKSYVFYRGQFQYPDGSQDV